MEKSCKFNQEQKLVILESVKEVGIKEVLITPLFRLFFNDLI